jgi:hypothetical protein
MKYFFHLKNHTEQILDEVGSPEQAYAQATQAIRELLAEGSKPPNGAAGGLR